MHMSRLDWFTIVIVSICLIALSFLVYKTIMLMGDDADQMQTELPEARTNDPMTTYQEDTAPGAAATTPDSEDQDLDDDELPYDPKEVEAPPAKEPAAPEKKPTPAQTQRTDNTAEAKGDDPPSDTTPKGAAVPRSYSDTGNYLVVAGSFSQRSNADSQIRRLKRLGYDQARIEMIRGGTLASALVGRYDSYQAAKSVVDELNAKGVEAIVKTQSSSR